MRQTLLPAILAAGFSCAALPAHAMSLFGPALLDNSTTAADTVYLGAPDDSFLGIGGQIVTFDFGAQTVINRSGAVDFNVYEVDYGAVEFTLMDVLVSNDGLTFTSVKASETGIVRIAGDSAHGDDLFARSYDLGSFASVRYIRIDGNGTGASGNTTAFDLDAIGAHEVTPIPEPATWLLMFAGLTAVARVAKRRC